MHQKNARIISCCWDIFAVFRFFVDEWLVFCYVEYKFTTSVTGGYVMDWKALDLESVHRLLPDRREESHKGDYGRILLLCGSRGYTGAAALAAMGALRCGAGLVYLAVPESIYAIEAVKLTEPIVLPLPDRDGTLAVSAVNEIRTLIAKMDAVLVGPGLGQSLGTDAVLRTVLAEAVCPVVVDADGINLLSGHMDILRGRSAPTVITPHAGEFQRFTGAVITSRRQQSAELARKLGIVVVLKGHHTVITDGCAGYINPSGNPGMAVGGSGDVLAGMITALIGQGLTPLDASAVGVWLHGTAGDICAREIGQYGMLPTDMLQVLPRLMK